MSGTALFQTVELPYCQLVMPEIWNAPRGRFFVAYRARHGFTSIAGNGVVDEFRTISGPVLLTPSALLGGIYDAGMLLAEERHVEAPIDTGWPPLTIGLDAPAPAMNADWRQEFIEAAQAQQSRGNVPWESTRRNVAVDALSIDVLQCSIGGNPAATVIASDAPLLPAQLTRLADQDDAPISVAVSTGNRLPYVEGGELHSVEVVPESRLAELTSGLRELLRG